MNVALRALFVSGLVACGAPSTIRPDARSASIAEAPEETCIDPRRPYPVITESGPLFGSCGAESPYEVVVRQGDARALVCDRKAGQRCSSVAIPVTPHGGYVRASVNANGKLLVVGRSADIGNGGWKTVVESYEVSTARRLFSKPLPMFDHVAEVSTVGGRMLVRKCVDAGPSCGGFLVEPTTGQITEVPGNLYGVDGMCLRIDDRHWGFVSEMDHAVVL